MNILITGSSGFIGKHLVKQLCNSDNVNRIFCIDFVNDDIYNDSKITFMKTDIREKINSNIEDKIDVCINLVALCKEPGYMWKEYFDTNYYGTKNIIEFAELNNIKKIIFTSTMMVFQACESRFSENDIKSPDTAYGISKLLAEEALQGWVSRTNDRELLIVRPGVVFGKGENGNYTRLFKAIKRNTFAYIGKKNTVKGSVYVKDLVRFIEYGILNSFPNKIYNFVFPKPYTIEEIVLTICNVFKWKRIVPRIPYKFALLVSYLFEFFNALGIKNPIHHRRIQKLYYSTNISSDLVIKDGFKFQFDLNSALRDWQKECGYKNLE